MRYRIGAALAGCLLFHFSRRAGKITKMKQSKVAVAVREPDSKTKTADGEPRRKFISDLREIDPDEINDMDLRPPTEGDSVIGKMGRDLTRVFLMRSAAINACDPIRKRLESLEAEHAGSHLLCTATPENCRRLHEAIAAVEADIKGPAAECRRLTAIFRGMLSYEHGTEPTTGVGILMGGDIVVVPRRPDFSTFGRSVVLLAFSRMIRGERSPFDQPDFDAPV